MKTCFYVICLALILIIPVFSQSGWTPIGSPTGGKINAILEKDGHYFVSVGENYTNGALYRSDDGGKTWTLKINGLPINYPSNALVKNDDYIYASVFNSGIFRSSDYGENWEACNNGIPSNALGTLTLYNDTTALSGNVLYAGTHYQGVYKSSDKGNNWTSLNNQVPDDYINSIFVFNNYVFVGTSDGIFRSLNGGNWEESDNGIVEQYFKYIYTLNEFNGVLFVGLSDKVYWSLDSGNSWQEVTNGTGGAYTLKCDQNVILYKTSYTGVYFTYTGDTWFAVQNGIFSGDYLQDLYVNGYFLLTGDHALMRSDDNGNTWVNSETGIANQNVQGLMKYNGYWFASSSDGIIRSSDNGASWETTYSTTTYIKNFYTHNNYLFANFGFYNSLRSGDNGETWQPINVNAVQIAGENNYLFAAVINQYDSLIFRSTDNGDSWTPLGTPLSIGAECILEFGNELYIGGAGGLFKSDDFGNSWNEVVFNQVGYNEVRNMFVYNNYIFLIVYDADGIYRSPDGVNWAFFPNSYLFGDINDFAGYGNKMFISTFQYGILSSEDNGESWQQFNSGLPSNLNNQIPTISDLETDNNILYATVGQYSIWKYDLEALPVELSSFSATPIGSVILLNWSTSSEINNKGFEIQKSENSNWKSIGFVKGNGTSTQTNNYSFNDNDINPGKFNYRLKQIDFDGGFKYSEIVTAEVGIPNSFSLEQNYPNPFNPSTKISFSLPVDSNVKIKLYNMIGQQIKEIINSGFQAGNHSIDFNAGALSSGVYLYRIESIGITGEKFFAVKKMLLLK
jgi:photosystem II stability/assembly factor-like uncharacterized protein